MQVPTGSRWLSAAVDPPGRLTAGLTWGGPRTLIAYNSTYDHGPLESGLESRHLLRYFKGLLLAHVHRGVRVEEMVVAVAVVAVAVEVDGWRTWLSR